MKKALVFWGGWDGHTPKESAAVLAQQLEEKKFKVDVTDTLKVLEKKAALKKYNLIVPMWTMGAFEGDQWANLNEAVKSGVGIAGVHGGMGDAFRGCLEYQWMTGGQFVGHPHVGDYTVSLTEARSPITKDMPSRFKYTSEQYYMLIDPAVKVLAKTVYKYDGQRIDMPVVWTKTWGKGKVFYSALGHRYEEFTTYPNVLDMTVKGMLWAARK